MIFTVVKRKRMKQTGKWGKKKKEVIILNKSNKTRLFKSSKREFYTLKKNESLQIMRNEFSNDRISSTESLKDSDVE